MAKTSAGLMMYRRRGSELEVLLVHPGGPYWRNRDEGAWSVPKGELDEDDEPLAAARREFREETGFRAEGPFLDLGTVRQKGGKVVRCWAVEGDVDPDRIRSDTFEIEWPPGTGSTQEFPEVDRAGFFSPDTARRKINPAQAELVDRLVRSVDGSP